MAVVLGTPDSEGADYCDRCGIATLGPQNLNASRRYEFQSRIVGAYYVIMKNEPAVCPTRANIILSDFCIKVFTFIPSHTLALCIIDYFRGWAKQDHACAK